MHFKFIVAVSFTIWNCMEIAAYPGAEAQDTDAPKPFWLKPLGSNGPCARIVDRKVAVDPKISSAPCSKSDGEGQFSMRQDKTVWKDGKSMVYRNGEVRVSTPEYRDRTSAEHDIVARETRFFFEFRPCGDGKVCLASDCPECSTNWEVLTA